MSERTTERSIGAIPVEVFYDLPGAPTPPLPVSGHVDGPLELQDLMKAVANRKSFEGVYLAFPAEARVLVVRVKDVVGASVDHPKRRRLA